MKIDLHGVKHCDVGRTLDSFFWQMMQKNCTKVEVITGISEKMKELVKETCKDYNFTVLEDPINIGVLIVNLK
jgi:DNA-nicking Smr family endonuclease